MQKQGKEYFREYRRLNKKRLAYQESVRYSEWRGKLLQIAGDSRCKDCGITDIRVLEFDHLGNKTANVTSFINNNWEKAIKEAKKCEVVCGNCHIIRTIERRHKLENEASEWIRLSKDHCPQGHPKTEENTYRWGGKKSCLLCRRDKGKEYMREKRRKIRNGRDHT